MSSEEIRKIFLDFFAQRGHKIIHSSSLIPEDHSVLLTTAGMQQFKLYFVREKDPLKDFGTQRVASIQKCFRTTDIEEIGDERHLTFFEMLGNFSFGPVGDDDPQNFGNTGYFKRSAIHWAYELLTSLNLKIDFVSVFKGEEGISQDKESFNIWLELGFEKSKIKLFGKEDNFWGPTGEEGPCGPTTEIYIDNIEIWNIVFNEYYLDKNKKLTKLQFPGIDTGMGLERLMKVIQKKESVFDTDLFEPLRTEILDKKPDIKIRDLRIILDHLRASVFLIADGVYPSNLERGYILRRILRRLMLKLQNYDLKTFLDSLVRLVIEKYAKIYLEVNKFDKILEIMKKEFLTFDSTLNRGIKKFEQIVSGKEDFITLGEKLFFLYTSYGLPLDITKELLKEREINIDPRVIEVFDKLFEEHKEISKKVKK